MQSEHRQATAGLSGSVASSTTCSAAPLLRQLSSGQPAPPGGRTAALPALQNLLRCTLLLCKYSLLHGRFVGGSGGARRRCARRRWSGRCSRSGTGWRAAMSTMLINLGVL